MTIVKSTYERYVLSKTEEKALRWAIARAAGVDMQVDAPFGEFEQKPNSNDNIWFADTEPLYSGMGALAPIFKCIQYTVTLSKFPAPPTDAPDYLQHGDWYYIDLHIRWEHRDCGSNGSSTGNKICCQLTTTSDKRSMQANLYVMTRHERLRSETDHKWFKVED